MTKRLVRVANTPRPAPSPRARLWRRRIGGTLMVAACFALPFAYPQFTQLEWHWPLPGSVDLGRILTMLPGAALVALVAPLVSYRRRDALTVLFVPPVGIRIAWIIGTRLAQLPHRTWPTREGITPVQGRQAARIAIAANRYRLWRQRRAQRAATRAATPPHGTGLLPTAPETAALLSPTDQTGSDGLTSAEPAF